MAPAADRGENCELVAFANLAIVLDVLLIHRKQKRLSETLQRRMQGKQFRARSAGIDRRFKLDLDLLLSDGGAGSAKEKYPNLNHRMVRTPLACLFSLHAGGVRTFCLTYSSRSTCLPPCPFPLATECSRARSS